MNLGWRVDPFKNFEEANWKKLQHRAIGGLIGTLGWGTVISGLEDLGNPDLSNTLVLVVSIGVSVGLGIVIVVAHKKSKGRV